jgi:TatA/E family protein of Tat protein translocase
MLSIPHLIIIFIVALVIFGPEKLPELARNLGKLMAEFRRTTNDLRGTFETHLRDLEREATDRRSETPRQPEASTAETTTAPAPANNPENSENNAEKNPEIVAAEGIVPANAPHNAGVALGEAPATSVPSPGMMDDSMMYSEDPEELIRQAEAQIARERAAETEEASPERVSDGAIGNP